MLNVLLGVTWLCFQLAMGLRIFPLKTEHCYLANRPYLIRRQWQLIHLFTSQQNF